jgi:type IV pilus assembly protein PilX
MKTHVTFAQQKGVALFIAMIALVVLLIAAVALIRSTDTAQLISGNLAVKRDLTHESELAVQVALNNFSGGLATEASRWSPLAAAQYFSSVLPSNAMGIPTALVNLPTTGESGIFTNNVTYSYMIDRMCPSDGSPDIQHCITGNSTADTGGNARNPTLNGGGGTPSSNKTVVYRISVRVTDPRQTQSYFQTTLRSYGS